VNFYDSTGMEERGWQKPYSEATGKLIDDEVRQLVAKVYQRTQTLLSSHQASLEKVARLLLEVLYKEDLEQVLGSRPSSQTLPSTADIEV
jgi:AFG3 family protein